MWGLWASAARASAFKNSTRAHEADPQNYAVKTGDRRSQISYALCLLLAQSGHRLP
jgi:hypothetical protein